jgi:hypothetical protein
MILLEVDEDGKNGPKNLVSSAQEMALSLL